MNISTRLMTLIKCSANAAACSPTSRISSKLIASSTGGQPISDAARKSSEKFIHTRLQTETVSRSPWQNESPSRFADDPHFPEAVYAAAIRQGKMQFMKFADLKSS